jgi:pullulanase/glycogen debranching enzyme
MNYMKEHLGAWQVGDDRTKGKVRFKIFVPKAVDAQIRSIRVAGTFQNQLSNLPNWSYQSGFLLEKTDQEEGSIWSYITEKELKAGFYQYKYFVEFIGSDVSPRIVSDPCTRYGGVPDSNDKQGIDVPNAGFVIGGSSPKDNEVALLPNGRKPYRDLIIYEIHLDDFTDEFRYKRAPLDVATDKIDYLADLGVNAVLLMPWTAWKNRSYDWGYEPFQYFAVEYRYANDLNHPEEKISWLKKLISRFHLRGIHVIMDGVFNHVSMDFPYKFMYKNITDCPFAGTFGETFPGLQDLNFNNACTQEFIRDVCIYWIDNFKIDGIRFDNTVNYFVKGDNRGIPELLEDISKYLSDNGEKNFSMTLEHLQIDAAKIVNEKKATSYWDNALYDRCRQYLWDKKISSGILNSFNNDKYVTSPEKAATIYLSNHDHSHVTWLAGANDNPGSNDNSGGFNWFKTQPYAIALLTSSGVPLIQNGQEFGEDYHIPEDDKGTGRRIRPRPLRWKLRDDTIGSALFNFYKRLIEIRNNYPALRSKNFYPEKWDEWQTKFSPEGFGVDVEKQVVIFHRWGNDADGRLQRFIIVLNFSDQKQSVTVNFPENGTWTDLLSDYNGSWKVNITDYKLNLGVGSNWGHIFFK